MSEKAILMDIVETTDRLQQFKRMPPEERTLHLGFIALSRCNDEKANKLFDDLCKGEAVRDEENAFFNHITQCFLCYSAFLQLIWLSTS